MSPEPRYVITTASADEVATLIDWAAGEGWNPGLDDAACFRAADPDGFLVGRLDGVMAAGVSLVRYSASYSFLGLFIVRPDVRGQGYGKAIWDAAIALAGRRTIGLDGVDAQVANYRSQGFAPAFKSIRHAGRVEAAVEAAHLTGLDARNLAGIAALDRRGFGVDRHAFLEAWLHAGHHRVRVWVEDGQVRGYGVARACRQGAKIGPLFADTSEIADALLRALAQAVGGEIILDTPLANPDAVALAERHGLQPVFQTTRMYKGAPAHLPLTEIYGLTSFELG
ncbi:MAG: GNAT family N-acetyltransferase [Geminicoccaceae bacterium]